MGGRRRLPPRAAAARPDESRGGFVEKPRVNIRRLSGATVIELVGEHDLSTHGDVEHALMEIGSGEACVVDLSPATFVDSSILKVLVHATSQEGACASAVVVAPPGSAAGRLFEITRATSVVKVCGSLDEALESVMILE
jgi:anti-anti-sigma factor